MADTLNSSLVVFCDAYSALYGAQRSMLDVYRQWHREGRYRLHFVYSVDGDLVDAVRDLDIPVTRIETGPLLSSYNKRLLNLRWWEYARLAREVYAYAHRLKKLLVRLQADLLHCNTDRAGLMSFLGARWARCRMVTHMRRDRSFGRLDRLIYYGTDEMIWVSKRVREEFGRTNRISAPKGRVIFNGRRFTDAGAPTKRTDVLAEFGLPHDAMLALVVASFDEAKDHETLVRAAAVACRRQARLYFLLAGTDSTPNQARRRAIQELALQAGLGDRLFFLGHRDDIGRLMRGADVLVSSSKHEALGGALIEALAYGLPCIATNTGGTSEIVLDGRCGYLVPRKAHVALAERTVALLQDEQTRERFAVNARAHFAENFRLSRCADETAAFFDEIIRSSPRRAGGDVQLRPAAAARSRRQPAKPTIAHIITSRVSVRWIMRYKLFELARRGYRQLVLAADDGMPVDLPDGATLFDVPIPRTLSPTRDTLALRQIVRILRRHHPDIVHTRTTKAGILGRAAARLAGVPIVLHTEHGLPYYDTQPLLAREASKRIQQMAGWISTRVLSQNRLDYHRMLRNGLVRRDRLIYEGNGVDVSTLRRYHDPERCARIRAEFGVGTGDVLCVMLARLEPVKRVDRLIDAIARISRGDIRVVICGEGIDRPGLELMAKRLGLDRKVTFAGFRADAWDIIDASSFVCLTSDKEGMPRSLMEAMAMGRAAVATDVSGTDEVVHHGETGLLVPPNDIRRLAGAIEELAGSRELRTHMGAKAMERAARYFDEREVVDRLDRLYEELYRGSLAVRGPSD